MIGYLRGLLLHQGNGEIILDAGGVGYRIKFKIPNLKFKIGDEVALFIHTAVKEDSITLYGFQTIDELHLFELLISVSGVGPKTGMEIVSAADSEAIEQAIFQADVTFFSKIKGIGKKSAQRIIIDLKNKIGSLKDIDLAAEDEEDSVFMALKQFGFKPGEITEALKKIDKNLSESDQVREGLRLLGKKTR